MEDDSFHYGLLCPCVYLLGRYIAMLFSSDSLVVEYAAQFFVVAGIFQLIDGTQISGLAALRAINDVTKPFFYAVFPI